MVLTQKIKGFGNAKHSWNLLLFSVVFLVHTRMAYTQLTREESFFGEKQTLLQKHHYALITDSAKTNPHPRDKMRVCCVVV